MKIESIIKREMGTTVVLGATSYHFAADEHGCHVCEVEDEAHIDRLLSIKEGYREVAADPKPADPAKTAGVEANQEPKQPAKPGRKAKAKVEPADPAKTAGVEA